MVEIIIFLLFYTGEDANMKIWSLLPFNFLYFNVLSEEGGI